MKNINLTVGYGSTNSFKKFKDTIKWGLIHILFISTNKKNAMKWIKA